MADRIWAVIPAAGSGSRMRADLPKQYLSIAKATVLEHSIAALLSIESVQKLVVAIAPDDTQAKDLPGAQHDSLLWATGGQQRMDSVLAALQCLRDFAAVSDWVLVHDAARPCVRTQDIQALITQVQASQCGGILALPVVDTVKRVDSAGRIVETQDRNALWCAQTPQMFRLAELLQALENARDQGLTVTDEASAMEQAGYPVQVIRGSAENLKITVAEDLALANWYLQNRP